MATDLVRLYIIQEQAMAAADTADLYAAEQVLDTFLRLREGARDLCERSGWSLDEFDHDVPEWTEDPAVSARRIGRVGVYAGDSAELLATLAKAKFHLRQLAGYLVAYAKAIEFDEERRLVAEAKVHAAAAARSKGKVGF